MREGESLDIEDVTVVRKTITDEDGIHEGFQIRWNIGPAGRNITEALGHKIRDDLGYFDTVEDALRYLDGTGRAGLDVNFADVNQRIIREQEGHKAFARWDAPTLQRYYEGKLKEISELQNKVDDLDDQLKAEGIPLIAPEGVQLTFAKEELMRGFTELRQVAAWLDAKTGQGLMGRIGDALKQVLDDEEGFFTIPGRPPKPPTAAQILKSMVPPDPQVRANLPRDMQNTLVLPNDVKTVVDDIVGTPEGFGAGKLLDELQGVLQRVPVLRDVGHMLEPIAAANRLAAQDPGNPVGVLQKAAMESDLYTMVEKRKAQMAILVWRGKYESLFGLRTNGRVTSRLVKPDPAWAQTQISLARAAGEKVSKAEGALRAKETERYLRQLNTIREYRDKYTLTPAMERALDEIGHTDNAYLTQGLKEGIDIPERKNYVEHYIERGPDGRKIVATRPGELAMSERIAGKAGFQKARRYPTGLEAIRDGYKLRGSVESITNHWEDIVDKIGGKHILDAVKPFGKKPSELIPPWLKENVDNARKAYMQTRAELWKEINVPDRVLRLQDEYFANPNKPLPGIGDVKPPNMAQKDWDLLQTWSKRMEDYANKTPEFTWRMAELDRFRGALQSAKANLKEASALARQGGYGDVSYQGLNMPDHVLAELNKYGSFGPGTAEDAFQFLRSTMVFGDFSTAFVQSGNLFWRNNPAWWKSFALGMFATAKDPLGYIMNNLDFVRDAIDNAAAVPPTEWLASSMTRTSMLGRAGRGLAGLPGIKQTQRFVEWNIFIGQVEMWKAVTNPLFGAHGQIGLGTREAFTQAEKRELAAVVRKELGMVLTPGLKGWEKRLRNFTFFAPAFYQATVGLMTDAVRGGVRGGEARRVLGSVMAGATATTFGLQYALNGTIPELDPDKPGWMSVKTGEGYVSILGPLHPYFRGAAQIVTALEAGDESKALKAATTFLRGRTGVGASSIIDFILGEDIIGRKVDISGLGIVEMFGRRLGPIGVKQALEPWVPEVLGGEGRGLQEGVEEYKRFPVRPFELAGGRTTPQSASARLGEARVRQFEELVSSGMMDERIAGPLRDELAKAESPQDWFSKLGAGERDWIDRAVTEKEGFRLDEYKKSRREKESIFQIAEDDARGWKDKHVPKLDGLLKNLMSGGDPGDIFDELKRDRNILEGNLQTIYESDEYKKAVAGLEPSDIRVQEDAWNNLLVKAATHGEVLDFDELDELRDAYARNLLKIDPDAAYRLAWNLKNKDQSSDAHPILRLKKETDNLLKPYYELEGKEQDAWIAANPNADRHKWLVRGDDTVSSVEAARQVLAMGLSKRTVRLKGSKAELTPDNFHVIEENEAEITRLLTMPTTMIDPATKKEFFPRTELRKSNPKYDALYFWLGFGEVKDGTAVVYNRAAVETYLRRWGPRPDGVKPRQAD